MEKYKDWIIAALLIFNALLARIEPTKSITIGVIALLVVIGIWAYRNPRKQEEKEVKKK